MNHQSHSRRTFLWAAAGAASAAALFPHVACASDESEPLLRWGVIGTGTRGAFTHLPVLKEAPRSRVVALCDVDESRLHAAAAKTAGQPTLYSDYQKLLADPQVNAVVIAVPNLLHRKMLEDTIQAGKHVLCEKPAGATPEDAVAMKRAVESAKHVVMFGMQYRNQPRNEQINQLVASGRIGKPRYIIQNCSRGDWNRSANVWQYADPKLGGKPMNWRFSHAATGGTLNEFDCHYFDLLHWMAGSLPQKVTGEGGISVYHDGRDTWDHATVTLEYPDDLVAVHTLCLFGPGRTDLRVMGEEGSLETAEDGLRLISRARKGIGNKIEHITPPAPGKHSADLATLRLYEDFVECVTSGKKPEADVDRAVAASRTCWLAERSSDRRATVAWDELT